MLIVGLNDKFCNIVIINFHDKDGPYQSLFYHPVLNMLHTCDAICAENIMLQINEAVDVDYDELEYGVSKTGLVKIETGERLHQVSSALQCYHENALNCSAFKRVCLPQDVLEKLWNLIVVYEVMFSPDRVDSIISDLRSDFKKVTTGKMCKLDLESISEENHWHDYFQDALNQF